MARKINRRRFLKASAAAAGAGFYLTAGYELHAKPEGGTGPNNRLNIAIIGAGGQGAGNLRNVAPNENIVALCDVDENRAAASYRAYESVPKYTDFRVMLERERSIDAVVVSTADHTHAIASITAMRMGKHCYCEKPLTHSVYEARQMRLVAARHRVATQMGNQGTSMSGLREGVEVIRSGAIGDIREVHVWTDRPGNFWRQGHAERPREQPEVPRTLSWDLWLGPAPARPYHPAYHPFAWRGWWDFGTGALGDMGCHTMNLAYMALQLGAPTSVVAECDQPVNNESPPNGLMVTYEFPARGNLPPVQLKWYEVRLPPLELFHGRERASSGSLFVGSRGTFYSPSDYGSSYVLLPEENFRGYRRPEPTLPRSPGHHQEWIRACKGGPPALSNFNYAGPLTETVLLGNVAIHLGQRFQWDPERLRAFNYQEVVETRRRGLLRRRIEEVVVTRPVDIAAAQQYIRREYRNGWSLG